MFDSNKPLNFNISEEDAATIGTEYIGELPPPRMALAGEITKIYCDVTQKGEPVFKVLYRASVESGYDGYTAWDNVTLTAKAAFKWKPLIDALGISVQELATGTVTDPNDESGAGTRVVRIGKLDLSGENTVPVYFGVKYRRYEGIMQTDVIGVRSRALPNGLGVFDKSDNDEDDFPFEK